jgi:hypothetical protein
MSSTRESALVENSQAERWLVDLLRRRSEHVISVRGWDWAAERLGVSPTAIESLLWRATWSADVALRVANRLGLLDSDARSELDAALADALDQRVKSLIADDPVRVEPST